MLIAAAKLTATDAMGFVIFSIASNPSGERRSFVWPGSGSTMGKLYVKKIGQGLRSNILRQDVHNKQKKLDHTKSKGDKTRTRSVTEAT